MNSHHANTPGTTRGPVRWGRASFDEDVFSGTEDTHVLSVVLLEGPPAERQRTGPRQCFSVHRAASTCSGAPSVSSFRYLKNI